MFRSLFNLAFVSTLILTTVSVSASPISARVDFQPTLFSTTRPESWTAQGQTPLRPVVSHSIKNDTSPALRDASITDIAVVVGDTTPDIKAAVGEGPALVGIYMFDSHVFEAVNPIT